MESIYFIIILVIAFFIRIEIETVKSKRRLAAAIGALAALGFQLNSMQAGHARMIRRVLMNNVLENRKNFNPYRAAVKTFLATSIKPSTPNYLFCGATDRGALAKSVVVLEAWWREKKISKRLGRASITALSEHLFGNESSAMNDPLAAEALFVVHRLQNSTHLAEFEKKLTKQPA